MRGLSCGQPKGALQRSQTSAGSVSGTAMSAKATIRRMALVCLADSSAAALPGWVSPDMRYTSGDIARGEMTTSRRGRRPAGSGTREAILEAARQQFGELGYRHTTLRSIGGLAGVDPRLVLHYFGSKERLFIESVELPAGPERVFSRLIEGDRDSVGQRAAELLIAVMEDPDTQRAMAGVIRAAASEPEQAQSIRELLTDRILMPMATRVGGGSPALRASLMASQVVGMMMARHVVGFAPLVSASREQLVRALAPVFQHSLAGDWVDSE